MLVLHSATLKSHFPKHSPAERCKFAHGNIFPPGLALQERAAEAGPCPDQQGHWGEPVAQPGVLCQVPVLAQRAARLAVQKGWRLGLRLAALARLMGECRAADLASWE